MRHIEGPVIGTPQTPVIKKMMNEIRKETLCTQAAILRAGILSVWREFQDDPNVIFRLDRLARGEEDITEEDLDKVIRSGVKNGREDAR